MLTHLKVSGFKNLHDVEIYFGPFTCIAGTNGVGKSNLFDAIKFLSALSDRPLLEAALSVREEGAHTTDVRSLFHRVGDTYAEQMEFEAEMIVSQTGVDDLGQEARASITFLRYNLTLALRTGNSLRSSGTLELLKEELMHINLGDAKERLPFKHAPAWRRSAVLGRRTSPLISTESEFIKLHQDGNSGRPVSRKAENLPRTVLSAASAAESPTALLARREMQSWRLLQLEPTALRKPDEFTAPTRLGVDGSHLAATLYHLARLPQTMDTNTSTGSDDTQVYGHVANRLSELIDGVNEVWVDRDERRELLTLQVTDGSGTSHPARALSDGTLRFLALAVLELEPESHGLLCLEEPENGIHPERIPPMLQLLQDIATDVNEPVGPDNPLRQVIINTHSPAVVSQVPEDSLLVAQLMETVAGDKRFKRVVFSSLPDTWRQKIPDAPIPVPLGKLLAYLNPVIPTQADSNFDDLLTTMTSSERLHRSPRRVIDRSDLQLMLPGVSLAE